MYCIMIEVDLSSTGKKLDSIQRQDFKSLIFRSIKDHIPEATVSFEGYGHSTTGSKWTVLLHTLESPSSKVISVLEKSFAAYSGVYGSPRILVSVLLEQ